MCQACGLPGVVHEQPLPRRAFMFGAAAAGALTVAGSASARDKRSRKQEPAPPKPENVMTPDAALARLMEGNKRYQNGVAKRHDFIAQREALVTGQNPYAAILGCSDSRIAPEYAFDSGRGDLFVVRIAGNFANPDAIASFEYGVDVLKTPLLLVLGHENCGAVKSTITSIQDKTTLPGHLPSLVAALAPAVKAVAGQPGDQLENATRENVLLTVETLRSATPLLSAAVNDKRLKIVGGIYRLKNGAVELIP
jgi:carbonic anhydrase